MTVQKFYLGNVSAVAGVTAPTSGEKSVALPVGTFTAGFLEKLLSSTISTSAAATHTRNTLAQTTDQDGFIARWSSPALAAATIAAGTWTFAFAAEESNGAANAEIRVSLYVWRPSTSSVAWYIYDSHNNPTSGVEFSTSPTGMVVTLSGSAAVAEAGDLLCLEVWYHAVQSMGTIYAVTFVYDGTTEPTHGASAANAASYLLAPAALTMDSEVAESFADARFPDGTARVGPFEV